MKTISVSKAVLTLAGLSVLFGFIAIFGYPLYCTHFSGAQVGKFSLAASARNWDLPGGRSFSFGESSAFQPLALDLDPQMNPVGFNWRGTYPDLQAGATATLNRYRAWLYLGERAVMQASLEVGPGESDEPRRSPTHYKSVGHVMVPEAGQYHFVLEQLGEAQVDVRNMRIEVRRNVLVANPAIQNWGFILAGTGMPLIVFMAFYAPSNEDRRLPGELTYPTAALRLLAIIAVGAILVGGIVYVNYQHDPDMFKPRPRRHDATGPPVVKHKTPAELAAISAVIPESGPIEIISAEPRPGRIGEQVTLRGSNFGSRENHEVSIAGRGRSFRLEVLEWSDDSITARIPNDPDILKHGFYYRIDSLWPREGSQPFMSAFDPPDASRGEREPE